MKLNLHATVEKIQVDRSEVFVVDNILEDVDDVRRLALAAQYFPATSYYPGRHAPVHCPDRARFFTDVHRFLNASGAGLPLFDRIITDFSVVTVPPSKLIARQQDPHIDMVPYFGLIYLSPDKESSTDFYRNRSTGLSFVSSAEEIAAHDRFFAELPNKEITNGYEVDLSQWDRIGRIKGTYNRLVFYPGNLYHAISPGDVPIPFDMTKARLTQRMVFRPAAASSATLEGFNPEGE